jgi:hypothetical protein
MMIMLRMYVAVVIELIDYIFIRIKCVDIRDRYNRELTKTKRCFNPIGLIHRYKMFLLFFKLFFLHTTFTKEIINDSIQKKIKIENEHPKRLLFCLIIKINLFFIYMLIYANNLIAEILA